MILTLTLSTFLPFKRRGDLVDLGQHPSFDRPLGQPTCFPYNEGTPSRRDYVCVSPDFLLFITDFSVTPPTDIPVHATLTVGISFPINSPTQTIVLPQGSIHDHFLDILRHKHGQVDAKALTTKQIVQGRLCVQQMVEKHFEDHDEDMQRVIQSGNPDRIWEKWNQRCIQGICSGFGKALDGTTELDPMKNYTPPEEKLFRLYGRPQFVQVFISQKRRKDPEKNVTQQLQEGQQMLMQRRRLQTRSLTLQRTSQV